MESPTFIIFVRHGHVYNPDDVYYGRLPGYPLSEEGRRQAQAAAETLGEMPIAAIFSSPLLRARQTAQIIQGLHDGVDIEVSELLNEVFSPFDGHPVDELIARDWDLYRDVDPLYEQPGDVLNRMRRFVALVRARYSGRRVVAVTHGDGIAFMILWSAGVPVNPQRKRDMRDLGVTSKYPSPASMTTFVYRTALDDEVPGYTYAEPLLLLSVG